MIQTLQPTTVQEIKDLTAMMQFFKQFASLIDLILKLMNNLNIGVA